MFICMCKGCQSLTVAVLFKNTKSKFSWDLRPSDCEPQKKCYIFPIQNGTESIFTVSNGEEQNKEKLDQRKTEAQQGKYQTL